MFRVRSAAAAEKDLRTFRAYEIRRIMDDVDAQLTTAPTSPSRRKKLLHGLIPPWDTVRPVWQLRVGDFRVFYDVDEALQNVTVRAVRRKGGKTTEDIL